MYVCNLREIVFDLYFIFLQFFPIIYNTDLDLCTHVFLKGNLQNTYSNSRGKKNIRVFQRGGVVLNIEANS